MGYQGLALIVFILSTGIILCALEYVAANGGTK